MHIYFDITMNDVENFIEKYNSTRCRTPNISNYMLFPLCCLMIGLNATQMCCLIVGK